MNSPARLWSHLRRRIRLGWNGSRHLHRTLPKIEQWESPWSAQPVQTVPVHVLTGAVDWRMAAWMLASWCRFSERSWPIVIHDDGTLPKAARTAFATMFPQARLIMRSESDEKMEQVLKAFPFCGEYRGLHPLALKIFDAPYYAAAERFLLLDSDVLFFNYPRAILDWVDGKTDGCWFNADPKEESLLGAKEAQEELSVKIWERVNTGLALIEKTVVDFDFCDRALAQTSILRGQVSGVEKTLYALCAGRGGKGGLLPPEYEVSLAKRAAPGAIARHYAGAARDRFYSEGIEQLCGVLLHPEEV